MKKKNLILSGLLLLGCAAGVTTYALAQNLPGISTYADTTSQPQSYSPANGAIVGSNVGVSSLYFEFKSSGDDGYAVNYNEDLAITVKKDGEVVLTIPVDNAHVTRDRSWQGRINVALGTTLKEPGNYTVEVPEGVAGETAFTQNGSSTTLSGAFSWSFSIEAAFSYTVSPRQGGEASLGQLANIVITYEEGTEITVNSGKATLYNFQSGKTTSQTTYTATAEGNVLTLTADTPSKITGATQAINVAYDYIKIPAGMLTLSNGGITYNNQELTIGNYAPRACTAADFTIIPDPSTPGLTIEDLKEVTIVLREGLVLSNLKPGATANAFTVNPAPYYATYGYQYAYKSISEDGRTIVGVMKDPTSATSLTNNTAFCQAGPSVVHLNASWVTVSGTTSKNAALDIPAWNLAGIEYAPIYSSTPQRGNVDTKLNGLTLNFPQLVKVENKDAVITLSFEGEVVKSVIAENTTTAAARSTGAGSRTVAFSNLFKNDAGADFTEPGTYTYHIPAGTFKQVNSEYYNEETDITVYIGRNYADVVKYPVPATFSGSSTNLQCTPAAGSDINEFTSLTLTYPVGTTFELIPGYENKLSTCGATSVGAAPALANNQNNAPTFTDGSTGMSWGSIDIKDNELIFNLKQPFRMATAKNRATCMWIAKGIFIAHIPNGEGGYDLYPNTEMDNYYQPFSMYQGRLATVEVSNEGKASLAYYGEADETNVILNSELGSIVYSGYQDIYLEDDNDKALPAPTATLTDLSGNVVANYTGTAVDENYGLSSANVLFTTTTDLSNLAKGIYTFTIAQGCLQGGAKSTTGALKVVNDKAFSYTIENFAIQTVEFEDVIKRGVPSKEEFSLNESFGAEMGRAFGMAVVQLDAAQGVGVNEECTEKVELYYGDTLLAEVTTAYDDNTGTGIMPYGISYGAEGDEWETTNTYLVMFNPMGGEQFNQIGEYTVKFPQGAFLSNGLSTTAAELKYTLVADQTNWEYSFSPAAGESLEDGISSIILTIENATYIDVENGNCATLVDPNGNVVPWQSKYVGPAGNQRNTIEWVINSGYTDWQSGTYTFTLKAHSVAINSFADEVDPQFPEEDIEVVYNMTTGVALVGVGAADSYTVYTVDGKAVLVNGTLEQVAELVEGLYIVNGKKALLRK